MDCRSVILIGLLGLLLSCQTSRGHGRKSHSHTHPHGAQHKRISASLHKQPTNSKEDKLHKKEEMLGQDMMKINEAEFKLQSLVSPEFHQGSHALHRGKVFGNMEVNTLSPEQVDFVQATSQWPKFSSPNQRNKDMAKTIYPENPVLFPQQNELNNHWISMRENSFKTPSGPQFEDVPVSMDNSNGNSNMNLNLNMNMNSMSNMNNMNAMFQGESDERGQQKANTMQYDVKPGYTTTADAPIDDKMPSYSQLGAGIKVVAKAPPIGFRSRPKPNAMSALLNEGIMSRHGKPLGILGNILKASQEMPDAKLIKESSRSNTMNVISYSRRHKLERTQQPGTLHKASTIFRHLSKEQKKSKSRL